MNLETMQREGREKVYKNIIYWVMNPSARKAIFTPKEANDVIDQHTAATWKAALNSILESGLLEEKDIKSRVRLQHGLGLSSWQTKKNALKAEAHNTAVRAVRTLLDSMKV